MKKYETPSYEIEYFKLKNSVLTETSENPDIDIDEEALGGQSLAVY